MALSQAEALAQIKEDLGLDIDYDTQEPTPLLARAAQDLGIELPGRGVRSDIYYVCLELGIETGWGWAPAEAPSAQPSLDSGEAEAELSHSAKVRAIFEKFDVDGDGRLSFHEGSAYSLAKEGEPLDDDTWAEVCGSLGFDPLQRVVGSIPASDQGDTLTLGPTVKFFRFLKVLSLDVDARGWPPRRV
jgi:hypothetical protein